MVIKSRIHFFLLLPMVVVMLSCQQQSIQYQALTNIQVGRIALPNIYITANVRCYNPNRHSFNIDGIEGTVHIDQQSYGALSLQQSTLIPAKDTFDIPIQLKMDLTGSFKNLPNIIKTFSKDRAFVQVSGTLLASKKQLHLKCPIQYEGFQSLKFN